jgi:hypothetical protein
MAVKKTSRKRTMLEKQAVAIPLGGGREDEIQSRI